MYYDKNILTFSSFWPKVATVNISLLAERPERCLSQSDCKYDDDECVSNFCVRTCDPSDSSPCGRRGKAVCSTAAIDGNNLCGKSCSANSDCESDKAGAPAATCQSGVCIRQGTGMNDTLGWWCSYPY